MHLCWNGERIFLQIWIFPWGFGDLYLEQDLTCYKHPSPALTISLRLSLARAPPLPKSLLLHLSIYRKRVYDCSPCLVIWAVLLHIPLAIGSHNFYFCPTDTNSCDSFTYKVNADEPQRPSAPLLPFSLHVCPLWNHLLRVCPVLLIKPLLFSSKKAFQHSKSQTPVRGDTFLIRIFCQTILQCCLYHLLLMPQTGTDSGYNLFIRIFPVVTLLGAIL